MRELDRAASWPRRWSALGEAQGVRTTALLTEMDAPLGRTAGNALEVRESVEVLAGGGPPDVVEVTLALAREMLALAGIDADPAAALRDGRAMDAGGGWSGPRAATPTRRSRWRRSWRRSAPARPGSWSGSTRWRSAWPPCRLGAGRERKDEPVSAGAGVVLRVAPGDP